MPMSLTTLTSRQFNQDTSRAKKAAEAGPVIITVRGRPAHVLLSFAEYERLSQPTMSLAEALAGPEGFDFDFDPLRLGRELIEPANFD
jgi:prevent-host-death family protein